MGINECVRSLTSTNVPVYVHLKFEVWSQLQLVFKYRNLHLGLNAVCVCARVNVTKSKGESKTGSQDGDSLTSKAS